MAETLSLWEFLRELVTNAGLRDWFAADPQGALRANGLDHLSPDDVHDALVLAEDNQTADFTRDYDTGHNAISYAPPPAPLVGESEHEAAIRYLNTYVTNNYVDDRDTVVDHSINQQVETGGGDFDQDIDVHSVTAPGDGAVAAGGDIDGSTVTTGDGNQVGGGNVRGDGDVAGDGNHAVTGGHDTTAFGSGNATGTTVHGDATVGDGGAFASGGSATAGTSDNSLHDVGNASSDSSVDGSFTDAGDHSVHSSFSTHEDASTHGSSNDNSEHTTSHSLDDESDNSTHVDNGQDHVDSIQGH